MLHKGICAFIMLLIISGLSVADDELINNDEAAGTIITKEYLVEDMYGHQHLVWKKLLVNGDGTYTSIPGGRSDNLKAIHEEFCEDSGYLDNYDNATIFIRSPEQEARLCTINPNLTLEEKIEAINNSIILQENEKAIEIEFLKQDSSAPFSTLKDNPKLSLTPRNIYVKKGTTYTFQALVKYKTAGSARTLNAEIEHNPKSNCSDSIRFYVPKNTEGQQRLGTLCVAPDYQTVHYFSASATLGALTDSARGTITIEY